MASGKGIEKLPPWKQQPKAKKKTAPLTPYQNAQARLRAEKAKRRYPNLVDNMWAAQHVSPQAPDAPQGDSPLLKD